MLNLHSFMCKKESQGGSTSLYPYLLPYFTPITAVKLMGVNGSSTILR